MTTFNALPGTVLNPVDVLGHHNPRKGVREVTDVHILDRLSPAVTNTGSITGSGRSPSERELFNLRRDHHSQVQQGGLTAGSPVFCSWDTADDNVHNKEINL